MSYSRSMTSATLPGAGGPLAAGPALPGWLDSSPMLIRHADPTADAAGCLAIYGPFAADTATSFEEAAPTLAEFAHRIERIGRTHAYLVAEQDGEIAGFAYAGVHRDRPAYRWSTEVSVYLCERYRGRGLGRALYEPLFALLEEQGYRMMLAGITDQKHAVSRANPRKKLAHLVRAGKARFIDNVEVLLLS